MQGLNPCIGRSTRSGCIIETTMYLRCSDHDVGQLHFNEPCLNFNEPYTHFNEPYTHLTEIHILTSPIHILTSPMHILRALYAFLNNNMTISKQPHHHF